MQTGIMPEWQKGMKDVGNRVNKEENKMGSLDSVWLPGNYCSKGYSLRESSLSVCVLDRHILATTIFREKC